MAEISPFHGIHYDPAKAGDLATVVGPPYDVIGPEEQMLLYDRSPYNFVRIMLNQPTPGDDDAHNPYTRAAHFLDTWLADGVLREDAEPALYVYRQEFTNPADGRRYTRTGLACALTLEPYEAGVVLPHEETRPKAKQDRLRLMRATSSDPEPIFAMYEDEDCGIAALVERAIGGAAPFESVAVDGDRHEVWRITDAATIAAVQERLRDRRVWIADGHHRYETALTYRDARRAADEAAGQNPQSAIRNPQSYDSLLVVLTAFNDPGIVVLPTHRLVKNVPEGRLEQLYLLLERYFDIEAVRPEELAERIKADPATGVHRFGVAMRGHAWVLTLRDAAVMDAAVMDAAVEGHSPCWKRLDVSILHALVLERCLDIPVSSVPTSPDIAYTRDWNEAMQAVVTGDYQLALLLNMSSAEEVRDVAAAGDKMPAKSTFFYPKLWSGLLLRKI